MIDMRVYRKLDRVVRDTDQHNIYVTVRGKARETIFKAKEALEQELGDRVSWQVFISEMAGRYLKSAA